MPDKKWEKEREENSHFPSPVAFPFITSVFFFLPSSLPQLLEQATSTSTLKPATLNQHVKMNIFFSENWASIGHPNTKNLPRDQFHLWLLY